LFTVVVSGVDDDDDDFVLFVVVIVDVVPDFCVAAESLCLECRI